MHWIIGQGGGIFKCLIVVVLAYQEPLFEKICYFTKRYPLDGSQCYSSTKERHPLRKISRAMHKRGPHSRRPSYIFFFVTQNLLIKSE